MLTFFSSVLVSGYPLGIEQEIFNEFPEVTFIIPHMGFGSINQIDTILSSHPNVYMTISKSLKKNTSVSKEISLKIGEGMVENKVLKPDWKNL